jgi:hypothetical protein
MPAAGNPQGADAPNVPTAAQLAQLATLQATAAAALVTLDAARISHKTAHAALLLAQNKVNQYQAYIYGGQKPGIYDEGGAAIT